MVNNLDLSICFQSDRSDIESNRCSSIAVARRVRGPVDYMLNREGDDSFDKLTSKETN